jgi:HKD family nuclease
MVKTSSRPFLGKGHPASGSVLIGAPETFDFLAALREAVLIKAAVAFGHMKGWREIKEALRASSANSIEILVGQAFFQTEPDVLDRLYAEEQKKVLFRGRLAPPKPTFHPKVWIIKTPICTHLIVGSANLSYGGFVQNTECSAYLSDQRSAESLTAWFDALWKVSSPLTTALCRKYREQYDKTRLPRLRAGAVIQEAADELEHAQIEWKRKEAIAEARRYFASVDGKRGAQERKNAMVRIKKCLKPPAFQFTASDWLQFLAIPEFGSMKRIKRNTAKLVHKLRKAFLYLADDHIPLATRIDEVVPTTGKYHVPGVGMNIATKVLAMLHPKEMPVYNARVEDTLIAFDYPLGDKKSEGAQYSDFCREVKSFVGECGFSDVLSIDSFFEHYSHEHPKTSMVQN